jgi:hypothetical protein
VEAALTSLSEMPANTSADIATQIEKLEQVLVGLNKNQLDSPCSDEQGTVESFMAEDPDAACCRNPQHEAVTASFLSTRVSSPSGIPLSVSLSLCYMCRYSCILRIQYRSFGLLY